MEVVLTIETDIFGSRGNIAVGKGSVWVITFDTRDKTLTRYDSESGAEQSKIALPKPSNGIAISEDAI